MRQKMNEVHQKRPEHDWLTGDETLLVVDDEELIIEMSREVLMILGYKVLSAGGGIEALEIYKKNRTRIDMVILDIIMPDLNGMETLDHMRRINPDVKVLIASGYGIRGHARRMLKRGCSGYIQKPYDIGAFSKKIRAVLEM